MSVIRASKYMHIVKYTRALLHNDAQYQIIIKHAIVSETAVCFQFCHYQVLLSLRRMAKPNTQWAAVKIHSVPIAGTELQRSVKRLS